MKAQNVLIDHVDYAFLLTLKALHEFVKIIATKEFFSIRNHHKCLSYLFLIHLNTYVMGLRPVEIF